MKELSRKFVRFLCHYNQSAFLKTEKNAQNQSLGFLRIPLLSGKTRRGRFLKSTFEGFCVVFPFPQEKNILIRLDPLAR